MPLLAPHDIRNTLRAEWQMQGLGSDSFSQFSGKPFDARYLNEVMGLPLHLAFCMEQRLLEGQTWDNTFLNSIPFYSLCKGVLLPLSGMSQHKSEKIFGFANEDQTTRQDVAVRFLAKDVGLDIRRKCALLLGDPFWGKSIQMKRDRLVQLLLSLQLTSKKEILERLRQVGDIAVLFAEWADSKRRDPQLTAAEVLETLHYLPQAKAKLRTDILRYLFQRMGRLESYWLARLILKKAGFETRFEGAQTAQWIASHFHVDAGLVQHAMALTDVFHVLDLLLDKGEEALKEVRIRPLVPFRPALASGVTDDIQKFPVWVERKYDGIRLLLHQSSDALGQQLCGAYSRNRTDFLENIPGLEQSIRMIPGKNFIIDGELYGQVLAADGFRPATVYEVFGSLQGQGGAVQLKFAAFDLIMLHGQDLSGQPLKQRRQLLSTLMPPTLQNLPISLSLAQGQLANNKADLNRLYLHFRSQGYEGIVSKQLDGPYLIDQRDPSWKKRKPELTLDLVVLGAVYAVTQKPGAAMFGSYVIGAKNKDGGFDLVGDVAGLDAARDAELRGTMMREGLATGRRIERQSASGVRPGIELSPHIVLSIKFEGIIRDSQSGALSLRDPKVVEIRSDKMAHEANSSHDIEQLHLKNRLG